MVADSAEPGAMISAVARRHGLTPQQLLGWRNQMRSLPSASTEAVSFATVAVAPGAPDPSTYPEGCRDDRGVIEIVLKGTVIRVRGAVTAETLAAFNAGLNLMEWTAPASGIECAIRAAMALPLRYIYLQDAHRRQTVW